MTFASVHFDTPPSANAIWKPGRYAMHRSAEYESWRRAAGQEVMAARKGGLKFSEPVAVIIIARRTNKRADIDNLIKPSIDALQYGQLIENDNLVESVTARWAQDYDLDVMQGRDVRVEIRSCA